MIFMEVIK